ncbi:growth arrest and DNA damage-inducible protein GADD45 alpha-like isoform X2 [Haliotis rubra]|uniref:growth arrest and DNA damage-inducible protein GADD45 alpha-like isoform X2 n=1 Tax=Haliotis rubra TaxID=36100 RepID=UPI001EE59B86|nr:growth arrest and DNA damage-inducible protein GADD45 alpha-like isoform X2 [Haliotis rubra]
MNTYVLKQGALSPTKPPLTPVLKEAILAHRVTSGVMECAKLLRCNPDNVMLCVLPEARGQHDVTLDIQHTLIEAFCWENDIQLIKVENTEKLSSTLWMSRNGIHDVTAEDDVFDMSCILIQYPAVKSPLRSHCRQRGRPRLFASRDVPP